GGIGGLRWRRNKLAIRSWEILWGVGSDVFRMAYRRIRDECEMWSSDEGKPNAKTRCTGSVLKSGV
ncbi:MAG: hypothetical protein ACXQS5_04905, partial [Candidatus Methanospirareceae archaeon]